MSLVRPALGHEFAPRSLAHRHQVLDSRVDVLQTLLGAHFEAVAALGVIRDVEGVVGVAISGVVSALPENIDVVTAGTATFSFRIPSFTCTRNQ